MKFLLSVLSVIALAACQADNLPKYNQLEGLRVLALIASLPEVDAGGSTTVTPILSDIGETTALTFEATGCISLVSAVTTCAGNSTAVTLQTGTMNTGDMTAARSFTGEGTAFTVNIPASIVIFNQRSAQDQFNGVAYLVTYTVRNSRGGRVDSFRRIIVSARPGAEKNLNPVLSDVLSGGATLTTTLPTGNQTNLSPSFGATTTETYRVQTDAGDFRNETEELTTTWFTSDGTLRYYRSLGNDGNEWTPPGGMPTGRDVFLLAVTRDGRGGLTYKRKCFGTCP